MTPTATRSYVEECGGSPHWGPTNALDLTFQDVHDRHHLELSCRSHATVSVP